MILCGFFATSEALTYAANLTTSDITTSSVTLTWTVPDDTSSIDSYVLMKINTNNVNTENFTITDLATTSYTATGLSYSSYFTFTIVTLDNAGDSLGEDSTSGVTLYNPINGKALAAIAIAGFIFLIWVIFFIAGKKCDPRKHSAQLKTEILHMKLKQREEKKKKLSSQHNI